MVKVCQYEQLEIHFEYSPSPKCDRSKDTKYVNISDWFEYPDYQNYYGPSSVAHIARFCAIIVCSADIKPALHSLVFHTDRFDLQRSNHLFLLGAFMILNMGRSVEAAINSLHPLLATAASYRTEGASASPEDYCEVADCLRAVAKAKSLGWLDEIIGCLAGKKGHRAIFRSLEKIAAELESMEDPANGDMCWIIPGRLIAMAGPLKDDDPKYFQGALPLGQVMKRLQSMKIGSIIRLNRKHYSAGDVLDMQIADLFMPDGSVPKTEIIRSFKKKVEETWGKKMGVAVHCRAGLGRTGTLIGCCLIDWFGFTAEEAIAYIRIARPGSVLGFQSLFLKEYEGMEENTIKGIRATSASVKRSKRGPKRTTKHSKITQK